MMKISLSFTINSGHSTERKIGIKKFSENLIIITLGLRKGTVLS